MSTSPSKKHDSIKRTRKKDIGHALFPRKTQMEVAEEIGISQAQVSRLEKAAIQQMNKHTR
ncbi:RNA polymerase sporulation specific sigma factor SigG [Geomicrobium sp. JCM 19039]|nr:RNA polymerase sporulation specific sigma factor SigG [Geomicrobium sp. JCM 19039]